MQKHKTFKSENSSQQLKDLMWEDLSNATT